MANTPREHRPDPMEREVDRLLAQLATVGSPPAPDRVPHGRAPARHPIARPGSSGATPPIPARSHRVIAALWARVLLGAALGGSMTQWPYGHECDLRLLAYLGAVLAVLLAGGWIALASWKLRSSVTHVLSLVLFFWGLVLAAEQVLPRIGYAADRESWRCSGRAVAPPSTILPASP